jgi:hypothetical protein
VSQNYTKNCPKTNKKQKDEIYVDICKLQLSISENMFKSAAELFVDKWLNKPDIDEAIKQYIVTFRNTYITSSINGWYDGKAPGYPVTNNALESHNEKLKNLCQRVSLSLREFLDALDTKVFSFWSFQRSEIRPDCKLYSKEPAITTQVYIRAFHWINLNLKTEKITIANEIYCFVQRTPNNTMKPPQPISTQLPSTQLQSQNEPKKRGRKPKAQAEATPLIAPLPTTSQLPASLTKAKCKQFLLMLKNCNWQTFDDFASSFQEIRVIKLNEENWKLSTCSCPSWFKHYNCKHIIGIAYAQNLFDEFPIEACEIPLGQRTKRGRPKGLSRALVKE